MFRITNIAIFCALLSEMTNGTAPRSKRARVSPSPSMNATNTTSAPHYSTTGIGGPSWAPVHFGEVRATSGRRVYALGSLQSQPSGTSSITQHRRVLVVSSDADISGNQARSSRIPPRTSLTNHNLTTRMPTNVTNNTTAIPSRFWSPVMNATNTTSAPYNITTGAAGPSVVPVHFGEVRAVGDRRVFAMGSLSSHSSGISYSNSQDRRVFAVGDDAERSWSQGRSLRALPTTSLTHYNLTTMMPTNLTNTTRGYRNESNTTIIPHMESNQTDAARRGQKRIRNW